MSGRCSTSLAGRLTGNSTGKVSASKVKLWGTSSDGKSARQRGQQIARLSQLFLQRRQSLFGLGHCYFLRGNIRAGDLAQFLLVLLDGQDLPLAASI